MLDRELDVLHVAVVALRGGPTTSRSSAKTLGHRLFHRQRLFAHLLARGLGERLRRADAGDHVLALGVDQELAVEPVRRRWRGRG